MDLTAFTEDLKTINAVERCLERISEAARKLGDAAEELCPAIPWPQLRAIGNFLRHEYDRIDTTAPFFVTRGIREGPIKLARMRANRLACWRWPLLD